MKRFFRKAALWLACLAAVLVVLLILFYAEEDWRGARDWAACQRELAAKGESLDLRQLVPPGKPEDDLSKAPIFSPLYQKEVDQNAPIYQIDPYFKSRDSKNAPHYSGYRKGEPVNLSEWQSFYRSLLFLKLPINNSSPAQDVLQVLDRFDPLWKQVDSAVSNPRSYFPINYDRPLSSQLGPATSLIRISQFLQLRGIAYLENQDSISAEHDYLSSYHLMVPLRPPSFLIYSLLSFAVRAVDDGILWEGLHQHAWKRDQLQQMEIALASDDLLSAGQNSFRAERAGSILEFYTSQNDANRLQQMLSFSGDDDGQFRLLPYFWLRPQGWHDEDKTHYVHDQQAFIDAIDLKSGILNIAAFTPSTGSSIRKILHATYLPFSTIAFPANQNTGYAIARAETYRRLARLACRLEEYRIAKGQYPEKLEDLPELPVHLNQEVLSEEPLRYSRKGDGYLLYSVGWDQKDDGGVLDPNHDERKGDWVWPSP